MAAAATASAAGRPQAGVGQAGASLGLGACIALVVGNMIGSGVFLLPAALAGLGAIAIGGWVLTSIGALILASIFARLARLVTHTGGIAQTVAGGAHRAQSSGPSSAAAAPGRRAGSFS